LYNQNLPDCKPWNLWWVNQAVRGSMPMSENLGWRGQHMSRCKCQVWHVSTCLNMSQPRLNHVFRFRTRLDLWPSLWQDTILQVFPAAIQSTPRNDDLSHHIIRGGPQLFLPPVIAPEKKTMTYLWLGKINHKDGCLHLLLRKFAGLLCWSTLPPFTNISCLSTTSTPFKSSQLIQHSGLPSCFQVRGSLYDGPGIFVASKWGITCVEPVESWLHNTAQSRECSLGHWKRMEIHAGFQSLEPHLQTSKASSSWPNP